MHNVQSSNLNAKGINARASVLSITSVLGELHHSSTRGHRGLHPSSPDAVGDSVSALTAGWSRTGMNSPCASPPTWGTLRGHPQPSKRSLQSVQLFPPGPGSPELPCCLATVTPFCAPRGSPFPPEGQAEAAFQGTLE